MIHRRRGLRGLLVGPRRQGSPREECQPWPAGMMCQHAVINLAINATLLNAEHSGLSLCVRVCDLSLLVICKMCCEMHNIGIFFLLEVLHIAICMLHTPQRHIVVGLAGGKPPTDNTIGGDISMEAANASADPFMAPRAPILAPLTLHGRMVAEPFRVPRICHGPCNGCVIASQERGAIASRVMYHVAIACLPRYAAVACLALA